MPAPTSNVQSRPAAPREPASDPLAFPDDLPIVGGCKVITGNAHPELAKTLADRLGVGLSNAYVGRFEDGEVQVRIDENIRGADVFVVQPTFPPASNLMELLVMLDAVRRASARRVTAVVPYFGYARQDRKDQPRVPITAKLIANLITAAGADRMLTMDLHSPQVQGFFDIPFDHLYAAPVLIEHFRKKKLENLVVVAPDIGSVKMARAYSKRLGAELALVDKRRPHPDAVEVLNVIGEVEDRHVVLFDDMVTTARTLTGAADAVRRHGARDVYAGITHAVFVPGAKELIESSVLKEVVVTNTVPHPADQLGSKVRILDVADILAEAVRRIHEERSLSSLFV